VKSVATPDAIAYLGDTLVTVLTHGLGGAVTNVLLSTPDDFKNSPPSPPAVTVFLYHVAICAEMRNARRSRSVGGLVGKPPLPLEMRFLITPWTRTPREAYGLVGSIALILSDHAVLTAAELQGAGVWAPDDTVELILEPSPVEELYDIWEPTEIPYKLSLSYLARLTGLDSTLMTTPAPVALATIPQVKQ
jgi:hypothetical protein